MSLKNLRLGVCTVCSILLPRVVSACPVCFGAADGPLLQGSNMGILAMLLATLAVLGAFGMFFRTLARRAQGEIEVGQTRPAAPAAAVTHKEAAR